MRSVCSGEKNILNNQNIPTRAAWPEQQQLLALLWEVGGVPGEEVEGNGNTAHESGPTTFVMYLQLLRLEHKGHGPAENLGLHFEA